MKLCEVIDKYAKRDSCKCGKCFISDGDVSDGDILKLEHVNVHMFTVALTEGTNKEQAAKELREALKNEYPDLERLSKGPSYIEMGGAVGDQGRALCLIGLGDLLGLWNAITPARMFYPETDGELPEDISNSDREMLNKAAGSGMIMSTGIDLR